MAEATAPLWRNTRFRRVRFLQILFWAVSIGFAALSLVTEGRESEDFVILAAVVFVPFALGMEYYRGLYVTALTARPEGLVVETLGFLGRNTTLLTWAQALPGQERQGAVHGYGTSNSWITLHRPGRRIPFILDTTEDMLDERALRRAARSFAKPR